MVIELTDTEWMNLIDSTREMSRCCGNVSHLRDLIIVVASCGGEMAEWIREDAMYAYEIVRGGHDMNDMPTLRKFMSQVYEMGETKHATDR